MMVKIQIVVVEEEDKGISEYKGKATESAYFM